MSALIALASAVAAFAVTQAILRRRHDARVRLRVRRVVEGIQPWLDDLETERRRFIQARGYDPIPEHDAQIDRLFASVGSRRKPERFS